MLTPFFCLLILDYFEGTLCERHRCSLTKLIPTQLIFTIDTPCRREAPSPLQGVSQSFFYSIQISWGRSTICINDCREANFYLQ